MTLRAIADKVERGERLTREDGLALFASPDLLAIGRLADLANRRKNGERVYFAANQHINPTNVCILRNTCVFCSFARMPKEDGAYTRSLEEVFAEADAATDNPTREFHIVGGLHPKLKLSYYVDMFRGLKQRHPQVMIKALTAVEVAHLARIEGMTTRDVLLAMKEAGVPSISRVNDGASRPNTRASSPQMIPAVYWRPRRPECTSRAFVGPVRQVETQPTAAVSTDQAALKTIVVCSASDQCVSLVCDQHQCAPMPGRCYAK